MIEYFLKKGLNYLFQLHWPSEFCYPIVVMISSGNWYSKQHIRNLLLEKISDYLQLSLEKRG